MGPQYKSAAHYDMSTPRCPVYLGKNTLYNSVVIACCIKNLRVI